MKTPELNLQAPGMQAPVVDIVFPSKDVDVDVVFDRTARKLVGALQRRFWTRRSKMLQARALSTPAGSDRGPHPTPAGELFVDLADPLLDWGARLNEYSTLIAAAERLDLDVEPREVRIRGWNETEAGILVDGRAVPGCIVDLAVALSHSADALREGRSTFVIHIPEAGDLAEEKLWTDLLNVAQDRLGVERGTVQSVTVIDEDIVMEGRPAAVA